MEKLLMTRSYLDNATFGKIHFDGQFVCYTIERPWLSNKPFVSCIPPGKYEILRHHTKTYPDSFVLKNLDLGVGINKGDAQRYSCCIHVANFVKNVKGCIGPGLILHPTTWGVGDSKCAMTTLKQLINLESEDWELEIQ